MNIQFDSLKEELTVSFDKELVGIDDVLEPLEKAVGNQWLAPFVTIKLTGSGQTIDFGDSSETDRARKYSQLEKVLEGLKCRGLTLLGGETGLLGVKTDAIEEERTWIVTSTATLKNWEFQFKRGYVAVENFGSVNNLSRIDFLTIRCADRVEGLGNIGWLTLEAVNYADDIVLLSETGRLWAAGCNQLGGEVGIAVPSGNVTVGPSDPGYPETMLRNIGPGKHTGEELDGYNPPKFTILDQHPCTVDGSCNLEGDPGSSDEGLTAPSGRPEFRGSDPPKGFDVDPLFRAGRPGADGGPPYWLGR